MIVGISTWLSFKIRSEHWSPHEYHLSGNMADLPCRGVHVRFRCSKGITYCLKGYVYNSSSCVIYFYASLTRRHIFFVVISTHLITLYQKAFFIIYTCTYSSHRQSSHWTISHSIKLWLSHCNKAEVKTPLLRSGTVTYMFL